MYDVSSLCLSLFSHELMLISDALTTCMSQIACLRHIAGQPLTATQRYAPGHEPMRPHGVRTLYRSVDG